jgi:Tim44-like domain
MPPGFLIAFRQGIANGGQDAALAMAGFASIIGLLLQVMLVVIVARLIFAWWQRRNMPAPAYAAATGHSFGGLSGLLGGTNATPAGEPLTIAKSDYDAFERLLGDIQAAYSAEDRSALRAKVTPEMLSYFSEQLAGNASRGLINRVTDVKLLQGDLAEAWREGDTDYATVAMKFALKDSMVESASGRTVEEGERSDSPNCGPSCARVAAIGCSLPSSRLDGSTIRLPRRQRAFAAWPAAPRQSAAAHR